MPCNEGWSVRSVNEDFDKQERRPPSAQQVEEGGAPVRVKHLGQEFVPIKRLFRCAQISNEKSSCKSAIYESVGLYVGQFVECLH
jgi:hypothetical protein